MKEMPTDQSLILPSMETVQVTYSPLAEIEWSFEGDTDDPNWSYLDQHANFAHKEACEFIMHVGTDDVVDGLSDYARNTIKHMRDNDCTEDFIAAYEAAARNGAVRILFWS